MGNELCTAAENYCGPAPTITQEQYTIRIEEARVIRIPVLSPAVEGVLKSRCTQVKHLEQLFAKQFQQRGHFLKKKLFGDDIYQGQLGINDLPHGLGKMYKNDGSLFIGNFISGKAEGLGLYIMQDGSYFEGKLLNNMADCEDGKFFCKQYTYQGGFKNNSFNGQGKQSSLNHVFTGSFGNGVKKFGQLRWWNISGKQNQYCYYGKFDQQGKFIDQGNLIEPTGKYTGSFLNGKKHGDGVYVYQNNLKYQGQYVNGEKDGRGKVSFSDRDLVIFQGNWKKGLPEGEGLKYQDDGRKINTFFKDGINILALRDPQSLT